MVNLRGLTLGFLKALVCCGDTYTGLYRYSGEDQREKCTLTRGPSQFAASSGRSTASSCSGQPLLFTKSLR